MPPNTTDATPRRRGPGDDPDRATAAATRRWMGALAGRRPRVALADGADPRTARAAAALHRRGLVGSANGHEELARVRSRPRSDAGTDEGGDGGWKPR